MGKAKDSDAPDNENSGSEEELTLVETNKDTEWVISINPEDMRKLNYLNFYLMVSFGAIVTKQFVPPAQIKDSALVDAFGYNNICIFWDYEPASWMTAMIYPFVEIPMLLYVGLNWIRQRRDFKSGLLSPTVFQILRVGHIVEFALLMWFRMIFVNKAFVSVSMHTAPFEGFQLAMAIRSVLNLLYYIHSDRAKLQDGRPIGDHPILNKLAQAYIVLTIVVTLVKQYLGWALICRTEKWSSCPDVSLLSPHGKTFDLLWMLLVAIVPFFLSFWFGARTEPLRVKIDI